MDSFTPAPKPIASPAKIRKWLVRNTKPIQRSALPQNRKPLPRSSRPIPQRNEARIARNAASYRKVIASDFHKRLRYDAYLRSGGLCECSECRRIRCGLDGEVLLPLYPLRRLQLAVEPVPVWFTKRGGKPWRRFRSDEGELHHTSYHLFGEENPAELELVEWTWDVCHQRIEASEHTRRRFLRGR